MTLFGSALHASKLYNHVFLECQLHVTCEPVECQLAVRIEDEFSVLGDIQVGRV